MTGATADANVPGSQIVTVGDLDDAADGGNFVVNGGSLPEFRLEFDGFNPERPRMVNTNFVPIAVSGELGGLGLRQFAPSVDIGPAATWGGQGFLETPSDTTVWNTNPEGYAGFRINRGGSNYNYGWALLEYRDGADQLELKAVAIESDLNTIIKAGAVPEPGSSLLLLSSLLLAAGARRRRPAR